MNTKLICVSILVNGRRFSRFVNVANGKTSFTDAEITSMFPEAKLRRGDTYSIS